MGESGRFRVPLTARIGAVALLFVAACAILWWTGGAVVERERRRAEAQATLASVGRAMEERGRAVLASVPDFPQYMGEPEWKALGERLGAEARLVLAGHPEVEGGFYARVLGDRRFLPEPSGSDSSAIDSVETQSDAAIRKRKTLLVVEAMPGRSVAIRTAPIREGERVVAATWATIPLDDSVFANRSILGYRLAAVLALSGIALSLLLTIGLARTVRRQAEERNRLQADLRRKERLASLGKLLAGVAHEVRNPLAGIRSTVQLWQRGAEPSDEAFGGLIDEVDRLEGIVSRLLLFSKANTHETEPGDLNAVVAEAARLARTSADSMGVVVETDLAPGPIPVAMASPAVIQVFRNLTTNALQMMPEGGVLTLATRIDPARGTAEASVRDTGTGISSEALKHLFEPFFTTRAEGTGLGLAIAREIALAHRGELLGRESTGLPRGGVHPAVADDPDFPRRRPEPMTDPPTILVADDDRTIRRNLVQLMTMEGFRALEAADGLEALAAIRTERPDAVLLDLKMPGRDGLEVLGALGSELKDLPVIVVTAFGGSAAAIEAIRRGAYDYLTKPFDLDEVLITLRRALRQRELARELAELRAGLRRRPSPVIPGASPRWSARLRRSGRSSRRSAGPRRPMSRC